MKNSYFVPIVLALIFLASCARQKEFDKDGKVISEVSSLSATVRLGATAPDFMISDQNGKAWKLSDYRGKAILIDFWAYWCGPCVAELGTLREWNNRYADDNFVMLGLNADVNDTVDHIAGGLKRSRIIWPQGILRTDSKVWADYPVEVFPFKIFVDKEGVIRFMGSYLTERQLEKLIDEYS